LHSDDPGRVQDTEFRGPNSTSVSQHRGQRRSGRWDTTITLDGQPAAIQSSKFAKSTGDEAGSLGGVASGVFIGETSFISFSPNVFFEGKPVVRLTDKALMNKGNTVCAAGLW